MRTAAAGNVTAVAKHLPREMVASTILPCVQQLVSDTSEHVKAALASVIADLAPLLGPEATKFQLIPMLQPLLRDPHADVRLNVIAKLEAINEVRAPTEACVARPVDPRH